MKPPVPPAKFSYLNSLNSWGTINFERENKQWNLFAQGESSQTNATSTYQLSTGDTNRYVAGNATSPAHFYASVWRLASASETLKFKYVPDR